MPNETTRIFGNAGHEIHIERPSHRSFLAPAPAPAGPGAGQGAGLARPLSGSPVSVLPPTLSSLPIELYDPMEVDEEGGAAAQAGPPAGRGGGGSQGVTPEGAAGDTLHYGSGAGRVARAPGGGSGSGAGAGAPGAGSGTGDALQYGSGAPRRPLAVPQRAGPRRPVANASRLLALTQHAEGPEDGVRMPPPPSPASASAFAGGHASARRGHAGFMRGRGRAGEGTQGRVQGSPGSAGGDGAEGDDEAHVLRQLFDGAGALVYAARGESWECENKIIGRSSERQVHPMGLGPVITGKWKFAVKK